MNPSISIVLETINPVDPKEISRAVKIIRKYLLRNLRYALALVVSPSDGDFRILAVSKNESLVDGFDLQSLPFVQVLFDGLNLSDLAVCDATVRGSQLDCQIAAHHDYVVQNVKSFGRQLAADLISAGGGSAGIGVYYSDLGHMATIGDLEWLAGPMPLSAVAIDKHSLVELKQFADKYDFYGPYLFEVADGRIIAINLCNYALNIGAKFVEDLRGISEYVSKFHPQIIRVLSDKDLGRLNPKISQGALDQIAEMFPTATIELLTDSERSTIEARILRLRQTGKGRWLDGK